MNNNLKYKLEDIEHAYFCYEKDCPICGGINYNLLKEYGKPKINKKNQYIEANPGEIWKIKTEKFYPIYVLIIRDRGFYKQCVRISEFTEFKGKGDLLVDNWLIECWNKFELLNYRLFEKVGKIDPLYIPHILKSKDFKEDNLIKSMFREIETEYQEIAFLKEDAYLFEKFKQEKINLLEKIFRELQKAKELLIESPSLSINYAIGSVGACSVPNFFRIFKKFSNLLKKEKKKKIFSGNIDIFLDIQLSEVSIEIVHNLDIIPEKIILLKDGNEEKFEKEVTNNKIILKFVEEKAEYQLIITFLKKDLSIKFIIS